MLEKLFAFKAHFETTPLWEAMTRTVEDSPYHREKNVAVHTNMVLDWYLQNRASQRTPKQQAYTYLGALFHDVGKPMAEVVKHSEQRGTYRAYHGHEVMSARLFLDYALTYLHDFQELGLDYGDCSAIALLIEHHVPFSLKQPQKRQALKRAIEQRGGPEVHEAWLDLLQSDQHGRTSDDQETKLANVATWLREWETV